MYMKTNFSKLISYEVYGTTLDELGKYVGPFFEIVSQRDLEYNRGETEKIIGLFKYDEVLSKYYSRFFNKRFFNWSQNQLALR